VKIIPSFGCQYEFDPIPRKDAKNSYKFNNTAIGVPEEINGPTTVSPRFGTSTVVPYFIVPSSNFFCGLRTCNNMQDGAAMGLSSLSPSVKPEHAVTLGSLTQG
jgi:hypothetical protein